MPFTSNKIFFFFLKNWKSLLTDQFDFSSFLLFRTRSDKTVMTVPAVMQEVSAQIHRVPQIRWQCDQLLHQLAALGRDQCRLQLVSQKTIHFDFTLNRLIQDAQS